MAKKQLRRHQGWKPSHPLFELWKKARDKGDDQLASVHMSDLIGLLRAGQLHRSPTLDVLHQSSAIRRIAEEFDAHSLVPPELAIWSALCLSGQYLAERKVALELDPDDIGGPNSVKPNLWVLAFAPSGAGKTFTTKMLSKALDLQCVEPPDTTAALRERLICAGGSPRMLLWDEFGSALGASSTAEHGKGTKRLLLEAHSGKVTRSLVDGETSESVTLSLLALTQTKLVNEHFVAQDWQSGLMQRMTVCVAPEPKMPEDARERGRRLDISNVAARLRASGAVDLWADSLRESALYQSYFCTTQATEYGWRRVGELMAALGTDRSFALRAVYTARKLALIMHILHGRSTEWIDAEDMAYAWDLVELTLHDLKHLTEESDQSMLQRLLGIAEQYYAGLQDKAQWTYRNMIKGPLAYYYQTHGASKVDVSALHLIFDAVEEAGRSGTLQCGRALAWTDDETDGAKPTAQPDADLLRHAAGAIEESLLRWAGK